MRFLRRAGLVVALVAAACVTELAVGPRLVSSLSVSPAAPNLVVGEKHRLLAVAQDARGVLFVGLPTTWRTDNATVATVDARGLVEGIAVGTATITAEAGGKTATAMVTVSPAPTIALSSATRTFSGTPGAPDPGTQTITITNTGGGTLDDVTLGAVSYSGGAAGWLGATLDQSSAPATLTLAVTTSTRPLGAYSATLPILSAKASNSPQTVTVTFNVVAATAATLELNAGDGQTAAVSSAVSVPPSVIARDAFGNPVAGVAVTFAVTGGGGAITGTNPATTNASGVAQVGWTLGTATGTNTLTATSGTLSGSPVTFNATAGAGPATTIALATGDAQTAAVNTAVPVPPAVLVTDAFGNPVAGVAVTFAVTAGGGNLTGATQTTSTSGIAQVGGWTLGQTAGANGVSATSGTLAGSPIAFTATGTAGPATQITKTAGDAQTATVNTAVATAPRVQVRDAFNNPIPGASVTFAIASGGGSLSGTNPVTTDASGFAQIGWTLGTTAGANSLTASAGGLPPATFTATGTADAATQIVKSAGDGQAATVATAVATPPRVQVRDQFGNGVPGIAVTFAIASGGGSTTGSNPATTDASGFAQIGWTLGNASGANSLTATATGLAGSPLTFTATATAGGPTQIALAAGDGQSATVNTAVATPPQVLVRDALGNPASGVAVTFLVQSGGGNISGGNQTTNGSGLAQVGGWVLGQTAGANTLTASATGLAGSPVTFTATGTAGAATQIALSAGNGQSATVNTAVATSPAVVVRDQFSNPVPGVSVTFAVTGGGGSTSGTNPAATNGSGVAQIGWTLGTTAGANSLTATATGLAGSPVAFTATGSPGAATQIAKSAGDAQTGTVATPVATPPRVQVRDQFGNGVGGIAVTFVIASGGGSLTGTNPAITDASGFAQIAWTLGNSAGPNSMTATATGLTGSPLTFTATAVAGGPTQIAVSTGNNQTATVNTAVAIAPAVIVQDADGNPVAGVSVTFAVTGGGGAVVPVTAVTTNGLGIAQVTSWTLGTTAGTGNNTLSATSTGLTGSPVTFTASATAGAATQIAVSAGNGQSATVNTAVATPPRVVVRDAFNNPVAGTSVTFAVTAGGGSLTGVNPATTDANGLASIGWSLGTTSGSSNNTLTATSTGLTGSPVSFSATATAGAATQIAVSAGNGQSATVNTTVATPPRVLVRDAFNNPVASTSVTFAVTAGGGSLTGLNPTTTDASGFASIGWTLGTAAGSSNNTLTATSTGLTGSPVTFTASATAGAATQIAVSQGNGQIAPVNTAVATPPRVIVRDAFNNPVAGTSVTFVVTAGGGTLTGTNPATTDVNGFASIGWTLGSAAGTNNNTLTATATGLTGSPVTFTASASAGGATQIALNAGNNQTASVNTAVATAPRVLVRDASNNPVAGISVTFAVTAGGGSLTGPNPAITDASGFASIGWTLGTAAGTNNNTLTATSTGLTGSPVTFTASAAAGAASQIVVSAGNGQTATVNTAVATPPRVVVRDAFGNPVAGTAVTFAVTAGGGSLTGANPATTDGSGFASIGWTLGTTAGASNNTLTATATGLTGSPVSFTASGTAGAATQIAVSAGNGQTATVNTAVATPPRVVVRDAFSNPVAGISVTFAVTGGGGALTGTNPATTDGNGFASIAWTLGATAGAGNNTLTATSTGLAGSPVTFTASATAGAATQIALNAGNNQAATVNTAVATAPRVLVRDASNNPVAGVAVTFAVTAGGGSLTGTNPATTDVNGFASIGWTLGTAAGTNNDTLTATATGLTGSPVTFTASATAGAATQIALNAGNNQTATVNTAVATAPRVLVRDAFSNPVAGTSVTFAVTAGGGSLTGTNPATTDAAGFAAIAWTLGTAAGTNNHTLTATSTGLTGSPVTFTASATPGAATQIAKIAGDNQSAQVNAAVPTPPQVQVQDAFGNGVAGQSVTFAVTSGGGALTGTNPATTDASGFAQIGWTLGAVAGANTISATATALPGSPSVTFTANSFAGGATTLLLTAGNNQTDTVGATLAIQYQVRVTDGTNGVAGIPVSWAVTGGGGSISPPTSFTDGSGFATATRTLSGTVGTHTATASAGALTGSPATFTATATHGAAKQIAVNAGNNQTATVNAAVAIAPSVVVRDQFGNVVPGTNVTFTVTGGAGTIVPASPATVASNGGGIATLTSWTLGTAAGTSNNTLTATAAGLTGSPLTFTASGTAGVATQIAVSAGNGQTATVNTAVATPPRVVVRDAFGNPVAGTSVTFAVTGGGGSLTGTNPATTDLNGVASIGWTLGSAAGTNNNTLSATSTGLTGSPVTFTASATAGAATQIALSAGNGQTATVNTAVATPPRVLVRDASNNPVAGVAVTFAVTAGAGSLTGPNPATSDGNGFASIGWTLGSAAGTNNNTLTATATGLAGSPVTFTASATAGAATQIALNAGNNQTATVNTAVATPPRVLVRDASNNPVAGTSVTFAVSVGGGSLTGPNPATTDLNGFASIGWTLGTAAGSGNNTVTATATGLTGSPVTFTASGTAGAATQIALNAGNGQTAAVNTAVATPPRVLVRDAFNNPVTGTSVTFAVTAGGGSLTGPNPATTDASGFASIGWTLGTTAGASNNTLAATATGLTGSPVTFTASATAGAASQIALSTGNGQIATVNTAVATPPQVLVRDAFNNPVAGTPVTFAVTAGGGSLTGPNPATSDGNGFASIGWTLGTAAGTSTNSLTATASGLTGSPVTFTASATAGAASQIAVSTGNGQTATVNTAVATPPRVVVRDAFGNAVAGTSVTFAVTAGGGSLTGTNPATTDASGFAQIGWTLGTAAGTSNNTLTATATGLTGSPVTFTASAAAGAATQIALSAGNGQTATVNTAVTTPPRVVVRDAFNNPVAGTSVTFAVTLGGGSLTGTNPATTDGNGFASIGWTLGTAAGTSNNTLTATSGSLTGSPVTFTASATAGNASASQSSVAATSPITASSGASQSTVTVTVRDAFNNPVGGATVTLSSSGASNTITQPALPTNSGGVTTGTISSTVAQSKTVSAVVNPGAVAIAQTATVVVNAAAVSAAQSSVSAAPPSITASNGASTSTITVTARDQFNNVVPSATVVLAASGSSNTVTQPVATTDLNGQTTGTVSSTAAEVKTVSATANGVGITQTASVTVTAAAAASMALNAGDNQSAVVNTAVAVAPSVIVRDAFSNVVQGTPVTFAVGSGGGNVAPVTPVLTDINGIASASWTLGTVVGTNNNTLTATSSGLPGSPVTFTASATVGAPSAAQSSVTASSPITASSGGSQSVITVTVRDAFSNVVPGANVTWSATGTGNSLTSSTGTTDLTGVFAAGRLSSTVAQAKTVSAVVNGTVTITQQPTVVVNPDVTNAGTSTVARGTATIGACSTSCVGGSTASVITVTARDQFSNLVANGTAVTISSTGSNNAFSPAASGTTTNGVYSANFTSTLAEAKTISAVAGGVGITQTAAVTVIGGTPASIALNAGNGQSAAVNTQVAVPPSVIVRDAFSNVVQGASVTFTLTGGGGTIVPATPATVLTSSLGTATLTSWTLGTAAGTNTLSASSTGLTGSPVLFSATGTPGAPSASQSTVAVTSPITASTGGSQSTITITVRDPFNNLISGAGVTWSATGTGNTATNTSGTTSGGVFNAGRLSSTVTGGKVVTAVVNGAVTITQQPTITVNPDVVSAITSTVTRSAATITACSVSCVAGTTASTVTVTAKDQFSNLVTSSAVTISGTGSGNTFNPASGSTNGSGVFTTNFNSTQAASHTITAVAGGVTLPTVSVTVNAAQAASIIVNGGNNQSQRVGLAVPTAPSVLVRDAFNNNVTGATVTFSVQAGGGNGTVSGGSQSTSNGLATVGSWTLQDGNADNASGLMSNTLSASVTPCSGTCSTSFTANAFYGWLTHVASIIGTGGPCQACHTVVFNRNPNNIVGVLGTTGASCTSTQRVVASNAAASAIYTKALGSPVCGGIMPPSGTVLTVQQLKQLRAWINNGALNN